MISNLSKREHPGFGSRFKSPDKRQQAVSEFSRDRQFELKLDDYYSQITAYVKDAVAIWIIGPGEAKIEFESFSRTTICRVAFPALNPLIS